MQKNLLLVNPMPFQIRKCHSVPAGVTMILGRKLAYSHVVTATTHQSQAAYSPVTLACLRASTDWMTVSRNCPSLYKSLETDVIFTEVSGTHHHSLHHKQVGGLAGESDSPDATSPYSRTPALRASHKMAERKRRTEMKYLFDALRSQIPASHGSKSSKWEILSKGKFSTHTLSLPPYYFFQIGEAITYLHG